MQSLVIERFLGASVNISHEINEKLYRSFCVARVSFMWLAEHLEGVDVLARWARDCSVGFDENAR